MFFKLLVIYVISPLELGRRTLVDVLLERYLMEFIIKF